MTGKGLRPVDLSDLTGRPDRASLRTLAAGTISDRRVCSLLVSGASVSLLVLNTLSRPGALLELTKFQCDLDRRVIYLSPRGRDQTKKRRPIVPITATLFPYIERAPAGPLVQFKGRSLSRITMSWNKAVTRAGLGDDVMPMTLRHTMAREPRRRGVQPWDVAGIMCHSIEERTTEIYAEYDPTYLKSAVDAIDSYMTEVLLIPFAYSKEN